MNREPIAALSGLGFSQLSRKPIGSTRELAAAAIEAAIADAGLNNSDIDGLLINRSPIAHPDELPLRLQNDLQLRDLGLLAALDSEGSSAVQMVQYAAMAIRQGLATTVACVFSDTPVKEKGGGDAFAIAMPLTGIEGWEQQHGFLGASAAYAIAAQRHMALYGTTAEQLGAYAVSCRNWAMLNPQAFLRKPLTIDEYLASPMVVAPLRMLDCCYPVNGAIALIVTSVARASDGPQAPVYLHGMGQGHRGRSGLRGDEPEVHTGAPQAAQRAYASAGVTARDVTACQFYDAFSYVGLLALEEYGLCKRGEAGAFVADGHTAPGGILPVNTGGGHLSGFYLQGVTPLSEGVLQVRAAGGERQIANNDLVLVTGSGGCLDYHACVLLSPHLALN
jgi:acetyl-CoA acetyltransferase